MVGGGQRNMQEERQKNNSLIWKCGCCKKCNNQIIANYKESVAFHPNPNYNNLVATVWQRPFSRSK